MILRLTSREFEIKPASFKVLPPKIVRWLIEKFPCYLGGRKFTTKPETIRAEDVHAVVADTLENAERKVPVVLVSSDRETDLPLAHPGRLAERIAALGEVFVLSDRWAAYSLIDEIGKPFACYGGAVRIYWPGFHSPRDPGHHFVYLPSRLRAIEASDRGIEDVIFGWLRAISVMRVVEGPVTAAAIDAIRVDVRRRRAAEQEHLEAEIAAGRATIDSVKVELEKVRQERDFALDRASDLGHELENQKAQWANWQEYVISQQQDAQPQLELEAQEFSSVLAALTSASVDFGRYLTVLDTAWESATESRYKDAEEVYKARVTDGRLGGVCTAWEAPSRSIG